MSEDPPPLPRPAPVIAVLASLSLVSYVVRSNISITSALIMPALGLSQVQMGQVFSAFMLGYALFQVPAGLAGDRWGPRRVLTAAAIPCSTFTALPGAMAMSVLLPLLSMHFGTDQTANIATYAALPTALRRFPALAEGLAQGGWAGLYDVTPDGQPVIDRVPAVEGFYCAAGFSGHGFKLAPAAGVAVSELVTKGRSEAYDLTPFPPCALP